jgi:hypothetical protein
MRVIEALPIFLHAAPGRSAYATTPEPPRFALSRPRRLLPNGDGRPLPEMARYSSISPGGEVQKSAFAEGFHRLRYFQPLAPLRCRCGDESLKWLDTGANCDYSRQTPE